MDAADAQRRFERATRWAMGFLQRTSSTSAFASAHSSCCFFSPSAVSLASCSAYDIFSEGAAVCTRARTWGRDRQQSASGSSQDTAQHGSVRQRREAAGPQGLHEQLAAAVCEGGRALKMVSARESAPDTSMRVCASREDRHCSCCASSICQRASSFSRAAVTN